MRLLCHVGMNAWSFSNRDDSKFSHLGDSIVPVVIVGAPIVLVIIVGGFIVLVIIVDDSIVLTVIAGPFVVFVSR